MRIPAELVKSLAAAKGVTVLTGAGVSAESGVPTFRDAQTGMWAKFQPEDLATPRAFQRNPRLVWEWYAWRRHLVAAAHPNPAHFALAEMELLFPHFDVITQNVDGLHQRAGNRTVIELHGNIARTKCFNEGNVIPEWKENGDLPPRCPNCGGFLRPDVVWFEESLPPGALACASHAAAHCNVFLSVGTSTAVYPAASLPFEALRRGAVVVEINPQPTALTPQAHHVIAAAAGAALPELLGRIRLARA